MISNDLKGLIWAEAWGLSGVVVGFLLYDLSLMGLAIILVATAIGLFGQHQIGKREDIARAAKSQ